LVRKRERKRLLGISRCGWDDNVKLVVKEIGWEGVVWFYQAQDKNQYQASMNIVMNAVVHVGDFVTS
jgi:hypothetical protein